MLTLIKRVKRTIELNKVFAHARCRLRLESQTRWVQLPLMMLEILKKHTRNGYLVKLTTPVPISVINSYLKLLKPAYLVNLYYKEKISTVYLFICLLNNLN